MQYAMAARRKRKNRLEVPKKERTTLAISPRTHAFVKLYADEKGYTMQAATEKLLGIALLKVWDKEDLKEMEEWCGGDSGGRKS